MSRVASILVGVLVVPVVIGTPVWAEQACPHVGGRTTDVLVCRGALSMGSPGTRLTADDDLSLRFRASPVAAGDDGASLPPGACAWIDRPAGSRGSRLVVLPMNGPLAVQPYPIGVQGGACAADLTCVMAFCAYDAGYELRAVDASIRLTFGATSPPSAARLARVLARDPGGSARRRAAAQTGK